MTIENESPRQAETEPTAPPDLLNPKRRRWPLVLALLVVVAVAAAGGMYAWASIGPLVQSIARGASGGTTEAGDASALPDVLATQQKTTEDIETLNKAVADQQEQMKAVVDQLAALSAKVDALQRPAAPAPAQQSAATVPPPSPVPQVAPKPRKPLPARAPKPAGAISTGGAPLNVTPDPGTR